MGDAVHLDEESVRVGDILLLQAGDLVPADVRLLEARDLMVDEWDLTGEIVPVPKEVDGEEVRLHRGSRVTRGDARGVVVAVGKETEYAQILEQTGETSAYRPPALVRWQYLVLPLLLVPPFLSLLRQRHDSLPAWMVALGVACLAVLLQNSELFSYLWATGQARRLRHRGIIACDPASLEVMAGLGVVCLDKTGVLTTREIEVGSVYMADGPADLAAFSPDRGVDRLIATACALCNDVYFPERLSQADPIDRALISFAARYGVRTEDLASTHRRIFDKPFDSEDRYMASGFALDRGSLYVAKGDPDVIVKMCRSCVTRAGAERPVDYGFRSAMRRQVASIAERGDIAMALAYRAGQLDAPPPHYVFLCLLRLSNPLQPGVAQVVGRLRALGVRPVMVTGDRPETAIEIGRQAGIDDGPGYCLTGKQMARMGLLDIAWQANYVSIFARILPSQKAVLLRLFQQKGHPVAMVGDGPNDAIALRAADVGVSFVEHSSPFARRVAQILIRDLQDLPAVIGAAKRLRRLIACGRVVRYGLLICGLAGAYAWMLT